MKTFMGTENLYKALQAEGLELPKECVDVRLIMGSPDEAIKLQYDCFVTPEDLVKVGRALIRMAEEYK